MVESAVPCKWVTQMWKKCDLYLSSKYFFPYICETEKCCCFVLFFSPEVKAYTLSTMGQDSQKAPAPITSDIQPPPPCPLRAPQGFTDDSCLGHHLQAQLWDWNQGVWQDTSSRAAFRRLRRMAETSRHCKRSPLLANFAQLEQCWKTSTGSWREGTAEIHFWPSSHLLRSMCPEESLQMLILQMSKKGAGVEPEGTDSINSMPSKLFIQEQALHQMYSFRLKVTFPCLLYWRSFFLKQQLHPGAAAGPK